MADPKTVTIGADNKGEITFKANSDGTYKVSFGAEVAEAKFDPKTMTLAIDGKDRKLKLPYETPIRVEFQAPGTQVTGGSVRVAKESKEKPLVLTTRWDMAAVHSTKDGLASNPRITATPDKDLQVSAPTNHGAALKSPQVIIIEKDAPGADFVSASKPDGKSFLTLTSDKEKAVDDYTQMRISTLNNFQNILKKPLSAKNTPAFKELADLRHSYGFPDSTPQNANQKIVPIDKAKILEDFKKAAEKANEKKDGKESGGKGKSASADPLKDALERGLATSTVETEEPMALPNRDALAAALAAGTSVAVGGAASLPPALKAAAIDKGGRG